MFFPRSKTKKWRTERANNNNNNNGVVKLIVPSVSLHCCLFVAHTVEWRGQRFNFYNFIVSNMYIWNLWYRTRHIWREIYKQRFHFWHGYLWNPNKVAEISCSLITIFQEESNTMALGMNWIDAPEMGTIYN